MSELLAGNLGGVVQPTSGNPTPISNLTKIKLCDFPFPISDRAQNSIPYFRPDPYPILLASTFENFQFPKIIKLHLLEMQMQIRVH